MKYFLQHNFFCPAISITGADAQVEMDAKKAAGYFADGDVPDAGRLAQTKGRTL